MKQVEVLADYKVEPEINWQNMDLAFTDVAPITKRQRDDPREGTVTLGLKTANIKRLIQENKIEQRFVGFKIDSVNKIIALAFYSESNDLTLQIHYNTHSSKVYLPIEIADAIKPILNKDKFGNCRKLVKYFKYQNYFCFSYANGGD